MNIKLLMELEQYSEDLLDTVSKNVKKYRERKGLSQMQLGLEIGFTNGAYIGKVELRKSNHHFNLKHLAKIAVVLDVDICNFFKP